MALGNVLILGDSYSTFEGWIPKGYLTYYREAGEPETDVRRVEKTWWHRVLTQEQGNLIRNSSYCGSTICNTGYDGGDYRKISFVGRLDQLIADGFFQDQTIDTVLVFGGTNDTWAHSPLGRLKWSGWEEQDLYSTAPACCYLMSRLRGVLPWSKVWFILNHDLDPGVEAAIRAACIGYGAEPIALTEMEKDNGHPTAAGMEQIAREVIRYIHEK